MAINMESFLYTLEDGGMFGMVCKDGEEIEAQDVVILLNDLHRRVEKLERALIGLKRGTDEAVICFCEMAIGHPNYTEHSKGCLAARKALNSDKVVK